MSREIIINKMYVGAYLSEGDNIGHEIVNLYRADDGMNYIYLNSQGTIDEYRYKGKEISLLLIRKFAPKIYKVLVKAEGVTVLDFADSKMDNDERYKRQIELGLTYGGVTSGEMFNGNYYHGNQEDEKTAFVTFRAERVIKPKTQLFITDDADVDFENTFFIRTVKGFSKQSLREYYEETEKIDSFCDLMAVLNKTELWEDTNTTQTVSDLPELRKDQYYNFLKIIKQEDHELAFSNMFSHFFGINPEAFVSFASEILHIDMNNDFSIEREKKNIDLLISDKNNVIVIENKIKSSINGVESRHDIYSELVQSQLKKYYQYVTEDEEYKHRTASCYIFSPNYNHIDLSRFSCGEKYTIVYYRDIYNFFVNHRTMFDGEPYFVDFVNALYKHTKDYDNDLEEEMQRRFQNAIYRANCKKGKLTGGAI